jgi:hypothetical protein
MPGRSPRQCRERWHHYLTPAVSSDPFTREEDALLAAKYAEIGPKWKLIAGLFEGRTDISIKNQWLLLNRRQRRAEAGLDDLVPAIPKPAPGLTLPAVQRPPPQEEIPWSSEEEDARKTYAESTSDLTGD